MTDQEPSWHLEGETLVVHVPMRLVRRGGRKTVMAPNGADNWAPPSQEPHSALLRALGRAHRWKRLLDCGRFASLTELAAAEKINHSYLCRILGLTLLAPDIVDTILDGRQPASIQLDALLNPFPVQWDIQRRVAPVFPRRRKVLSGLDTNISN